MNRVLPLTIAFLLAIPPVLLAQASGSISGRVSLAGEMPAPVRGATVSLPGLGLVAISDSTGAFRFERVPAGQHEIFAQRGNARSPRRQVSVAAGETVAADFLLAVAHVLEAITVTGNPRGQTTALEAFGALTSVSWRDLSERMSGSLGETLDGTPGIAKRSFGPGSSRPIVRGFDGDRVLIMQDGLRTGDVSSSSGDHGVLTDPASLKRVEVLKGPATLLYGSNAVGGVVNAISYHDFTHEAPPSGTSGFVTLDAATDDERVGGNFEAQYGANGWLVWGGGGARRSGDYDAPDGTIENSSTRMERASIGGGRHWGDGFLDGSVELNWGRYGVPFAASFEPGAEPIDLSSERMALRLNTGLRSLGGFLEDAHAHVTYIDWSHEELEGEEVGTQFSNETLVVRAEANHRARGKWSGTFGVWGQSRSFEAVGEEALSPPVDQLSFALFALEELDLGAVRLAGGARLETNNYDVAAGLPDRSFTGVSGSFGVNASLAEGAALYASVSRSHRSPALEELYNNGPHIGNLTFEEGDPDLGSEITTGLDAGVRLQSDNLNLEVGAFVYDIADYVFLQPTGEIEDGLPAGRYSQGDARYMGLEAGVDLRVSSDLRILGGIDLVRAELTTTDDPLPRIPPLRARLGLDVHVKGLDIRPEAVFVAEQDRVFGMETTTDGYTLLSLTASYTVLSGSRQHVVSLRVKNLGDELYRNHSSFIKDLAPEQGRSAQLTYSVRFF